MATLPGAGSHRFWGFSPALDLLGESGALPAATAPGAAPPDGADAPRRMLLLSPGDPRHILRTLGALSRLRASEPAADDDAPTLEFSVYEMQPELLARHLLLLSVALDFELPRRERAELLLELMANSLLREKAAAYLAARAAMLCRVVTDGEGPLAPLVDLSLLKMRDRDALHDVLRSWGEDVPAEMVKWRDERLRGLYKERYDMRRNVLDWDYTMNLVPLASIVHKIHFREWRQTGVAFELRDSAYVAPNRSLVSMCAGRERGRSVMKRGFWGDVANSPFAAVGVECDEPRFYKRKNEQHFKNACDVAYYNVLSWLTELETGKPYKLREEDIEPFEYGSSVAAPTLPKGFLNAGKPAAVAEGEEEGAGEGGEDEPAIEEVLDAQQRRQAAAERAADAEKARKVAAAVTAQKLSKLPRFKLRLLSGEWGELVRKPRLQRQHSLVTVGAHFAHLCADARLNQLLAPRALALVESAKFLVEVHASQRMEFAGRVLQLGALLGWTRAGATAGAQPLGGSEMGPAHPCQLTFGYDAETAPALAAEVKRQLAAQGEAAQAAAAAPLALTDASAAADGAATADGEGAVGVEGPGSEGIEPKATGAGGAAGVAGMLGSLAVGDDQPPPPAAAPVAAAAAAAAAAAPVAATAAKPADAAIGKSDKVCVITGLPAKYKDPQTGLPYANLDAYKELRKQYPAPAKPEAEQQQAEGEGDADRTKPPDGVPQRPIIISSGPCGRRINKVA